MGLPTEIEAELIISKLFVAGINYRLATVAERSLFNITQDSYKEILEKANEQGFKSLFALSTCNRTELYAYCNTEMDLIDLWFEKTNATKSIFKKAGFVKRGYEALEHLFLVGAGLDSQIIGDYEILGQLKSAVAFSRKYNMIGPVMDRTLNFALQASKTIKTNTKLSTGTVSVSYAAVEWLQKIPQIKDKKILLFGTGKFGRTLAKNLSHYFPLTTVTIINRTDETASLLAETLYLSWQPFSALIDEVKRSDIIIVCTNANEYTLLPAFFSGEKQQWILDLSVPENTHPAIKNIGNIEVTGIDEVSQVLQATLDMRKQEINKALAIIAQYKLDFYEWLKLQKHIPLINEMKNKLYTLGEKHLSKKEILPEYDTSILSNRINKTVGSFVMNLRHKNEKGCHYINAINEFLQPGAGNE